MNTTYRPTIVLLVLMGAPGFAAEAVRVEGKNIRIELDDTMHSRVVAAFGGQERAVGDFTPSESIRVSGNEIRDFSLQKQKREPDLATAWGRLPNRNYRHGVVAEEDGRCYRV
jgi:hypothetical protein